MGFLRDIKIKTDFSHIVTQNGLPNKIAWMLASRYLEVIRFADTNKIPPEITARFILTIVHLALEQNLTLKTFSLNNSGTTLGEQFDSLKEAMLHYRAYPTIGNEPSFHLYQIQDLASKQHLIN